MRARDRYILATVACAAVLGGGVIWQNQSEKRDTKVAATETLEETVGFDTSTLPNQEDEMILPPEAEVVVPEEEVAAEPATEVTDTIEPEAVVPTPITDDETTTSTVEDTGLADEGFEPDGEATGPTDQ